MHKTLGLSTVETKLFIEKIDAFEAPFLEEKLLEKGVFSTHEEYVEAFSEFKKYVTLVKVSNVSLGMTSKQVDEVWHQFILFTKDYFAFCNEYLGYYLHHTPKTKTRELAPGGVANFASAYKTHFGVIPAIWNVPKSQCGGGQCEGCSTNASTCGSGCSGECTSCHSSKNAGKNPRAGQGGCSGRCGSCDGI